MNTKYKNIRVQVARSQEAAIYVSPAEQMKDDASGPDDSDIVSPPYQEDTSDPMGLGGI